MFSPIEQCDFEELKAVVADAIRTNVAPSAEEADRLISEVRLSLEKWQLAAELSFHHKCQLDGVVAGFIIVKNYWNLSHLFVRPDYQGRGIGRELVQSAIEACREKSPCGSLRLNSSPNATGFYSAMGFRQTGDELSGGSGCVPFEFDFETR